MREVKRHAKAGETIKIVNAIDAFGLYKNGDTFAVPDINEYGGVFIPSAICEDNRDGFIGPEEYVVLEPPTAAPANYPLNSLLNDPLDDPISRPAHYTAGGIECIDAIEAATTGLTGGRAYATGAAIKYLWRWSRKGGAEDLRKARWYIDRLIADAEG